MVHLLWLKDTGGRRLICIDLQFRPMVETTDLQNKNRFKLFYCLFPQRNIKKCFTNPAHFIIFHKTYDKITE